ncbi:DUF2730 family protein [Sphingopyxis macrogoltabida]|uniref:DUF2730 domain-containing protein n=1 Tax=Sphingopyxis macrogoltabida TaxID=33050 RepID=A0AAC8Z258_SPHMC|nr:DUF2730 family protein [Sphingopyxis macrogoltabida]ALJ14253.1 hypothetical protein LH19_15390 [Sphingopyxis macrogoltabida]AMU90518.1 hypothetical protein ATM17_15960 [Sphingopyxis macrogoltabida]
MDLALFTQWAGAIGLALGIINMAWNMAGRAAKPVTEKFKAQDDRLDKHSVDLKDHDRRIQTLEGLVPHLPTSSQVNELRVTVERIDTHLLNLDKTIELFTRMVTRIDDYLRENKA